MHVLPIAPQKLYKLSYVAMMLTGQQTADPEARATDGAHGCASRTQVQNSSAAERGECGLSQPS